MTRGGRGADVAVYAPFAASFYAAGARPVGGAELQSGYLARTLAEHGYRVRHLVFGDDVCTHRNGVEVVRLPSRYSEGGVARRRAVLSALREADASLYIQRSAGFETGVVGLYARSLGRRFVFSSSSDGDFAKDSLMARRAGASLDEWPTRLQYLLGLRLAHVVVAQTEDQRALARRQRGVEARVIRSFCGPVVLEQHAREAFLWVGGLVGVKNPLAYVELAARVPEATFWMVGTERGEEWMGLAREVRARAEATPNLRLLPPTGRDDLLTLYGRAVAVVNTSWFEGFPNTFLEGWTRGAPALSLRVDPDRAIDTYGLGAVCGGSTDELAAAARAFWERRHDGDSGRFGAYLERFHHPDVVGEQWAALVSELLAR